jgi:hypothetical protein
MASPLKHEMTIEEIAAAEGTTVGAVNMLLSRALKKLRASGFLITAREARAGAGPQSKWNCRMTIFPEDVPRLAEDLSTGGFTSRSFASVSNSDPWPTPAGAVYPSDQTDGIPLCNYPRRIAGVRNERRAIYDSSYLHTALDKKSDRDWRCPISVERALVQNVCARSRRPGTILATSHATTNSGRRNISVRYKAPPRSAATNDSRYASSTFRLGTH